MKHVASIACSRLIVDAITKQFSMLDICGGFSEVVASQEGEAAEPMPKKLLSLSFTLVTMWRRSDANKAEQGKGQVRVVRPDGTPSGVTVDFKIDLTNGPFFHHTMVFPNVPNLGQGFYEYQIFEQVGETWRHVASVPLLIQFAAPQEPGSEATLGD